jgi:hypothetical protein
MKPAGEYRNLQEMEGRPGLWEFQAKDRAGKWYQFTNLGAETDEDRKQFAQKTADAWMKRK